MIALLLGVDLERFAGFWADTYVEQETTHIDVIDLVDRFARAAGAPLTAPQRSGIDEVLGRYRDLAVLDPQPEAVELIAGLSRRARLGLLSNCYEREVRSWADSPLVQFFQAVVFSYQIGALKPDPSNFRAVLAALDVEPGKAVFVGNGPSGELEGARAFGFGLIVHCNIFDRANGLATEAEQQERASQADVSVVSFDELAAALRA